MSNKELRQIERNLSLLRQQKYGMEETKILAPDEEKVRIGQRIEKTKVIEKIDDSSSQDIISKVNFSAIPEDNIQQAYQNALPPDANLYENIETNEISQILAILKNFRRLDKFFELLSQDQNIASEIRHQCRDIASQLTSKKHPKENNNQPNSKSGCGQNETLESYLIATLNCEDDSNQGFLLNAWLIPDESIKDISHIPHVTL